MWGLCAATIFKTNILGPTNFGNFEFHSLMTLALLYVCVGVCTVPPYAGRLSLWYYSELLDVINVPTNAFLRMYLYS